jgi:hypothetical protein
MPEYRDLEPTEIIQPGDQWKFNLSPFPWKDEESPCAFGQTVEARRKRWGSDLNYRREVK